VDQKGLTVASFFSGAGGLDLGFENAGFQIKYANEYDSTIWETYERNFPKTHLDKRSITEVQPADIPEVEGFIGGPPCQSWSEAGAKRGLEDARGRLFLDYIRLLKSAKPYFFLAENVSGILHARHSGSFGSILDDFREAGYEVYYSLMNASDYQVPEDRKRVIIVGVRRDIGATFSFPSKVNPTLTLRDALAGLGEPIASGYGKQSKRVETTPPNHEYMTGGFSSMYMSRNRVRGWDEPSFTIQAGARHAPIHPQAPRMERMEKNQFRFKRGQEALYRRLSVRECARIQTFPDEFVFEYENISDAYKMIGNAVPSRFAFHLATSIRKSLESLEDKLIAQPMSS
jgi:DNA (cytosine-5)-methyltransferase 1